jgi:hypothetical protein
MLRRYTLFSAFVAASRRKDRSLDARLESANRASMLHKKRTGKALNITKEIVEKEAMYEEIDERYQEKRLRMLQAQNMQIEDQFQRQLLAAFAAGANSTRQASRISQDGGVRKMRIDIPPARDFLPGHHRSISSVSAPMSTNSAGFVSSPAYGMAGSPVTESPYVQSPGSSYVQTPGAFPNVLQQQVPAYLTPSQSPAWALPAATAQFRAMSPQAQSVAAWRQQVLQRAPMGQQAACLGHPSRQRLASAPDALCQQRSGTATPVPNDTEAARAKSEPSHPQPVFSGDDGQMLSPTDLLTSLAQDAWPTPELSPSPTASSASPMSADGQQPSAARGSNEAKQPVMVSTDEVDPEFDEFTRFALRLESAPQWPMPVADPAASFDDWLMMETLDSDLTLTA